MTTALKRFIAGAVCPQCQLVDKTVVYRDGDIEHCECVRCGHHQQQVLSAPPKAPPAPVKKTSPASREHVIQFRRQGSEDR